MDSREFTQICTLFQALLEQRAGFCPHCRVSINFMPRAIIICQYCTCESEYLPTTNQFIVRRPGSNGGNGRNGGNGPNGGNYRRLN